ncbi:SRPBCC family protein [Cellulomonas fengjieae]|uniref:SRPBCC family protein n=1 Tax=Cellulomonas fengjieae TaxID=2819978 RepID=A0ABS3SKT5_9CELL|nr:SRPBCC family protein [Cellulomonas fengjieae]MBO3085969.1 SRPBCC family protein [Cellulomonas fengjieae]MBO3103918.1 SRPBCC family protein [Cellulomonas fengjieae]QVI65960.1 SRPBCC family protein [Cellulomonas fengjieae]
MGSRHLSVRIDRPVSEVYEFAADPANLHRWAPGLGTTVAQDDDGWFIDTTDGRVRLTFAPRNEYGVLDHEVRPPSGEPVYVPLRVVADGDGCEVVFTLRRSPGMTDAELDRDAALVTRDLGLLKRVLEGTAG